MPGRRKGQPKAAGEARTGAKKYGQLLQDPDIVRWYENVARGSQVTADVYLRRLGSFCRENATGPRKIVSLDDEHLHNLLLDFVSSAERRGYAGSYIHSTIKAVRSWLVHDRRDIRIGIKIRGAQDAPSLKNERVPTPRS